MMQTILAFLISLLWYASANASVITGLEVNQSIQVQFAPPDPWFNGFAHFDLLFSPNFTEYIDNGGQPTQGIVFAVTINSAYSSLTLNIGLGNSNGFNCHYVSVCPTSGSLFVLDPSTFPFQLGSDILTIGLSISYLVGSFPYEIGLSTDLDIITPGVPEPSTWAMMMIGFVAIGFIAMRQQRLLRLPT
jgi:hypothetical protein